MADIDNILFLSVEDLNDWIEPLGGHPDTITPNLTRLAERTMLFDSAYAPAPACSPARTAALFGQNPWTTGVYANQHKWHDAYPHGERCSLVGRLRDQGYATTGAGKVFHVFPHKFDHADWDAWHDTKIESFPPITRTRQSEKVGSNTDFGPHDGPPQYDELNTDWMIAQMTPGARGQFWALGLYRPHLPFIVPQHCFDALPDVVADPPGLGMNRFDPHDLSRHAALPPAGEAMANGSRLLRRLLGRHKEYKDFLRAYLASIHYADELLGRVLDHMDAADLWKNTLVVLWSDHGWQLGEKLAFRKFTLWERALRVPLMIGGPGIAPGRSTAPVSLIDIAPTLFARLGLTVPDQFEGQDLSPVLDRSGPLPRDHAAAVWGTGFDGDGPRLSMTARSETHRYILYWDGGEELYDHRTDPWEHRNLIREPGDLSPAELDTLRERHQLMLPPEFADPVG